MTNYAHDYEYLDWQFCRKNNLLPRTDEKAALWRKMQNKWLEYELKHEPPINDGMTRHQRWMSIMLICILAMHLCVITPCSIIKAMKKPTAASTTSLSTSTPEQPTLLADLPSDSLSPATVQDSAVADPDQPVANHDPHEDNDLRDSSVDSN